MSVVVVGVEQHQAPLELIEQVTVPEDALGKTLATLRDHANLTEVVVLSTCLRTELYAVVERFHEGVDDLQAYLAAVAGRNVDDLADHLTVLFDDAVAVHLFEVASGLRSAVLGESEVLGQVRRAAERARGERAAGPVLSALFGRAVQAGRRVRASTAIARGSTSLSHIAVELAETRVGGSLEGRRVLVVGAGDMGAGVVDALGARRAEVVVANRTRARAGALAGRVGGRGVGLSGLPGELAAADAMVVSTGASLPVVEAELVAGALTGRRHPLVVVDIGVPRNVDPDVGRLAGVELHDMDDLRAHAARTMADRRAEVARAREIVRQEVERYREDTRARGAAPIISALRGRLEEVRASEIARRRHRTSELDDAQWDQVEAVTRDVLAKVLHQPTVVLKDAAGTPRGERLVEALRALYDL